MIDPRERVVLRIDARGSTAGSLRAEAEALGFTRFARPLRAAVGIPGLGEVPIRLVGSPKELASAFQGSDPGSPVLLRWRTGRVIPLESALARHGAGRRVWVVAESALEVPAALGALERGAEVAVVPLRRRSDLRNVAALIGPARRPALAWGSARVESVQPVGVGDRLLLDTLHLLPEDGGFLVGSAAAFLFLVVSEAKGSSFSAPRAFRVNAGSPHSYVLCADGTTRYLSELEAGGSLQLVRPRESVGVARLGRVKIERRPLVMVRARRGGRLRTVFLQEAETVRLSTPRGPVPVTDLKAGTSVLGVELPPARHLGDRIDEHIEER